MRLQVVATDDVVSVSVVDGSFPVACADMDFMGDYWWLSRLKVKPNFQRQGWGRKLIAEIAKHAKGVPIVVSPGGYPETPMEIKVSFYEACGFVDIGQGQMRLTT
jgi:GNAT superfamily N-acetyltransferase